MSKKVMILAASNGKNLELAKKFEQEINQHEETSCELIDLCALGLPLYTPTEESDHGVPKEMQDIEDRIVQASHFVFVAPEYNGGVPPTLTNFLAWSSRLDSESWRAAYNGKPAVIASHSGGGGTHALMAMRVQLSYIGMNVMGRQVVTNSKRALNPDSLKVIVDAFVTQ